MMSSITRSKKKETASKGAEKSQKEPTKFFSAGKGGEVTDYVLSKVETRFEPVFSIFHRDVVAPGVTPVFHIISVTKYQYKNTFGVLFESTNQSSHEAHRKVRVTGEDDKAAALDNAVDAACSAAGITGKCQLVEIEADELQRQLVLAQIPEGENLMSLDDDVAEEVANGGLGKDQPQMPKLPTTSPPTEKSGKESSPSEISTKKSAPPKKSKKSTPPEKVTGSAVVELASDVGQAPAKLPSTTKSKRISDLENNLVAVDGKFAETLARAQWRGGGVGKRGPAVPRENFYLV